MGINISNSIDKMPSCSILLYYILKESNDVYDVELHVDKITFKIKDDNHPEEQWKINVERIN